MKTTLYAITISIVAFACTGNSDTSEDKTAEKQNSTTEANVEDYSGVVADYIELKNALVNSDVSVSKVAGEKLATSLDELNMDPVAIAAAGEITTTDDIEAHRKAFKTITDAIIPRLENAELSNTVYIQYCPMAFENSGASWLSVNEEIKNPYFGDRMLKCGKIEKEL